MNRHWLGWQSTTWWETMESWLEVSLYIFVFLESVLSSGCFYSSCFVFIVLSHQLIIVLTWVNLMGWAGRGQCTDLASWLLDKMYMLLLAVICCLSILISCYCLALVDHVIMPIFPFHFIPPLPQIVEIFHQIRDQCNAIFTIPPSFLHVQRRQSVRL